MPNANPMIVKDGDLLTKQCQLRFYTMNKIRFQIPEHQIEVDLHVDDAVSEFINDTAVAHPEYLTDSFVTKASTKYLGATLAINSAGRLVFRVRGHEEYNRDYGLSMAFTPKWVANILGNMGVSVAEGIGKSALELSKTTGVVPEKKVVTDASYLFAEQERFYGILGAYMCVTVASHIVSHVETDDSYDYQPLLFFAAIVANEFPGRIHDDVMKQYDKSDYNALLSSLAKVVGEKVTKDFLVETMNKVYESAMKIAVAQRAQADRVPLYVVISARDAMLSASKMFDLLSEKPSYEEDLQWTVASATMYAALGMINSCKTLKDMFDGSNLTTTGLETSKGLSEFSGNIATKLSIFVAQVSISANDAYSQTAQAIKAYEEVRKFLPVGEEGTAKCIGEADTAAKALFKIAYGLNDVQHINLMYPIKLYVDDLNASVILLTDGITHKRVAAIHNTLEYIKDALYAKQNMAVDSLYRQKHGNVWLLHQMMLQVKAMANLTIYKAIDVAAQIRSDLNNMKSYAVDATAHADLISASNFAYQITDVGPDNLSELYTFNEIRINLLSALASARATVFASMGELETKIYWAITGDQGGMDVAIDTSSEVSKNPFPKPTLPINDEELVVTSKIALMLTKIGASENSWMASRVIKSLIQYLDYVMSGDLDITPAIKTVLGTVKHWAVVNDKDNYSYIKSLNNAALVLSKKHLRGLIESAGGTFPSYDIYSLNATPKTTSNLQYLIPRIAVLSTCDSDQFYTNSYAGVLKEILAVCASLKKSKIGDTLHEAINQINYRVGLLLQTAGEDIADKSATAEAFEDMFGLIVTSLVKG